MCAATCAQRALPCAWVGGAGWCVCPRCRPLACGDMISEFPGALHMIARSYRPRGDCDLLPGSRLHGPAPKGRLRCPPFMSPPVSAYSARS